MSLSRLGIVGLVLAAGLGLSACASDGYYGGASIGYGGYYGDPYYDDYYGGYGYGYAPSYYGWYGDYYYPGTGIYVYDRYRRPHRWSDSQRRYWSRRGEHYRREHRDWRGDHNGNWGGWNRGDRDRGDHDWNRGGRGSSGRWHGRTPRTQTPHARTPRVSGQRGTTPSRSSRPSHGRRGDRHHR
ncbi:MAG TPA: hypothetical protein VM657_12170 [Sphingomonas sp.]|nr:hypothetical protein [Sphingomonas sp.]